MQTVSYVCTFPGCGLFLSMKPWERKGKDDFSSHLRCILNLERKDDEGELFRMRVSVP